MFGHGESVDVLILTHHMCRAGEGGRGLRGHAVDLNERAIARIDPYAAVDGVGSFLLRRHVKNETCAPVYLNRSTRTRLHVVVGGDEPGLLNVAGQVDLLLVVEEGTQSEALDERRSTLREDGVGFADSSLVVISDGHFGGGMCFIAATKDRVVLGVGECEDVVVTRDDGCIDAANDRGIGGLSGGGCEYGENREPGECAGLFRSSCLGHAGSFSCSSLDALRGRGAGVRSGQRIGQDWTSLDKQRGEGANVGALSLFGCNDRK